jgi:hypothetical protein
MGATGGYMDVPAGGDYADEANYDEAGTSGYVSDALVMSRLVSSRSFTAARKRPLFSWCESIPRICLLSPPFVRL